MKVISNAEFGGERPLFESHDLRLENVIIRAGESAIKECSNIEAVDCRFEGNYPFWHVHGFVIDRCFFDVGGRSALWYSDNLKMTNTRIDAPKMFREMHDIEIENVEIKDADEVFWRCKNLDIKNLKLHGGTYPFMFSSNIRIDGLEGDSKYVFQYVKNVELRNAKITTKDAFWEVENVTIYDSELNGEYLGWHSHNLRLVNCHITGEQPLCYAHDLVLENCTFGPDCDRAFEYSSVQATIKGAIGGVKNPRTGCITAESYGEIILDENIKAPADCKLKLWDEKTCFVKFSRPVVHRARARGIRWNESPAPRTTAIRPNSLNWWLPLQPRIIRIPMVMTDTRYTASKTVSTIACIVDCSLSIDQIDCNTAFLQGRLNFYGHQGLAWHSCIQSAGC